MDIKERIVSHQTLRNRPVTFDWNGRLHEKKKQGVLMRKSTIFISTVLTTFALVVLYGIVSAYQNISNVPQVSALSVDPPTPEPTMEPTIELAAAPTSITPEQAAQKATQVVGNTNLLSAESSNINGVDAYKITFTNNDVVYVGLDGQILGVQIAPVVVNVEVPVVAQAKHRNNNNTSTSSGQSHDDNSEHDD